MTQQLTTTQRRICIWLARRKSLPTISAELAIKPSTLRVHLSHIRAITGVATLDPAELTRYLERTNQAPKSLHLEPTAMQRRVLLLLVQHVPYASICAELGISKGTAMNHASQGCKRLGITFSADRLEHIRAALCGEEDPMNDPQFQP